MIRMKTLLLTLILSTVWLLTPHTALADCTSTDFEVNGKKILCTTCCTFDGQCQTSCN